MSRLAGKFAGIVLVTVADKRLDALMADLALLEAEGLQVVIERTQRARGERAAATPTGAAR